MKKFTSRGFAFSVYTQYIYTLLFLFHFFSSSLYRLVLLLPTFISCLNKAVPVFPEKKKERGPPSCPVLVHAAIIKNGRTKIPLLACLLSFYTHKAKEIALSSSSSSRPVHQS